MADVDGNASGATIDNVAGELVGTLVVAEEIHSVEWGETTVLVEGGQQVRGIPRLVRG